MQSGKLLLSAALLCVGSIGVVAAPITFSTFVSSSAINAVEGQNATIGFTYAGNKFVGSVYFGVNNNQLYSTSLTGGSVQTFGSPIPGGSGEIVVAGSLGQGGFASGGVYAGTGSSIYQFGNSGGVPALFASGFDGTVRSILFDPGSSFGGEMLVTTSSGTIYTVDSAGNKTILASVHEDTEGMDIATSAWGSYAGDVLVGSEGSGTLRLISPSGTVTVIGTAPVAETVSFVPLNLGLSGNPIEGFYVANYAHDIQFAGPAQFAGLQGDAIVTSEDGSNSRLWDVHYTGSGFTVTQLAGHLPNQSEDGIFVTAARINDTAPEPSSVVLLGSGVAGLAALLYRRRRTQACLIRVRHEF